jgi:hypothetical protein
MLKLFIIYNFINFLTFIFRNKPETNESLNTNQPFLTIYKKYKYILPCIPLQQLYINHAL